MRARRPRQKLGTVALLCLGSACAPKVPAEDNVWDGYGAEGPRPPTSSNGSSSSGASCEVRGHYGMMNYRAQVQGNSSKASLGIVKTTADLGGDSVIYHQGIIKAQAGLVEETAAHFTLHLHDSTSSPIADGATELYLTPGTLSITSQGCTTREVAFGTLHLAAMIIIQRNQSGP